VSAIAKLSPISRRNLQFMFLGALLFWACMAAILPIMSPYLQGAGANNQQVGWIMGAFAVGLLAFRSRMGLIADRQGRRGVMLIGITVAAIAPLCYPLTQNLPLLTVIRVFHGLSIAAYTTGYSALVADLAPPESRGEVIGYMSLSNPVGMAIGPALSGYLQPILGDAKVFYLCSALAFGSLALSAQIRSGPPPSQPEGLEAQTEVGLWALVTGDRLRIPTLNMLTVGLAFGILSTFVPLFIREMKIDVNVGLFYTMAALSSFGSRFIVGKASDRFGRGPFLMLGLVCYCLAMVLLWRANTAFEVLFAGLVEGFGGGTFMPLTVALVSDRAYPHERGRMLGLCIGGFDLGIALSGALLGQVADWLGYRMLFGVAAAVVLVGTVVFVTLSSQDLRSSVRFALGRGRDLYALPR
jgi:MFS family permease